MRIRFGTSGVRGLTDQEISPELCYVVSKALGSYFGAGTVALGHDTRPGARQLAGVCAAAFSEGGLEVVNYGVAPAPVVCAMILENGLRGGLMVSGSHLSYDRIGLIPLDADGTIPPRGKIEAIEKAAESIRAPDGVVSSDLAKADERWYGNYLEFLQGVTGEALPCRGVRVALDPGGATGAGIVSRLMNDLGSDAHAINDRHSEFAPRRMEPRQDSVGELMELVRDKNASFGAAYDADCDRVLFVDETGAALSEDLAAVLFARHVYDSGPGVCVMPINSSGLMYKVWNDTVEECIIGPPEISEAVRVHDARFAYEESGKYFFPPRVLWADGIVATVFMAQILARTKKRLSELVSEFPRHTQIKRNIRGGAEQMSAMLKRVRECYQPQEARLNDLDGLKYVFEDGSWLLFRPSGTEPVMRVYVDSPSPLRAQSLSDEGVKLVKRLMEEMA
jgi:phosphomannomutase